MKKFKHVKVSDIKKDSYNLHYVSRFQIHSDSVRLTEKTKVEKCGALSNLMMTVRNPVGKSFFEESMNTIIKARKVLAYTYPIAYYIMDRKLKAKFEFI